MTRNGRSLVGVAALSLVLTLLFVWLVAWAAGRVLGLAGLPPPEERERLREIEKERLATMRRVERRQEVVAAVVAGRMTLTEAAAVFRELNRSSRSFSWEIFRRSYEGASDDERHCRQVIGYVRAARETYPGQEDEVVRHLEAELWDRLQRGTLRLPDLPAPAD